MICVRVRVVLDPHLGAACRNRLGRLADAPMAWPKISVWDAATDPASPKAT